MNTDKFPSIPEDLLLALEEYFPDRLPRSDNTPVEKFYRLQGSQDVIVFLRCVFERQNRNILESS